MAYLNSEDLLTNKKDGDRLYAEELNISQELIAVAVTDNANEIQRLKISDTSMNTDLSVLQDEMDAVQQQIQTIATGINILGVVQNVTDLPGYVDGTPNDTYTGEIGDAYSVEVDGYIWVWKDTTQEEPVPVDNPHWTRTIPFSVIPLADADTNGLMTSTDFNNIIDHTGRIISLETRMTDNEAVDAVQTTEINSLKSRATVTEADVVALEQKTQNITAVDASQTTINGPLVLTNSPSVSSHATRKDYVDTNVATLQTQINTKANTTYVDSQDDALSDAISALNTKVSEIAFGASLLQENITTGGLGGAWPLVATNVDMTVATKPSNYQPLFLERKFTETNIESDRPYLNFKAAGRYKMLISFNADHTNALNTTLTVRVFVNNVLATTFINNMAGEITETFKFSELWDYEKATPDSTVDVIHVDYMSSASNVTARGLRIETILETSQAGGEVSVDTDHVISTGGNFVPGQTQTQINDFLDTSVDTLNTKTQNQTADVNGTTFSKGINFGTATVTTPDDVSKHIELHTAGYGLSVSSNTQNYVSGQIHDFLAIGGSVLGRIKSTIDEPKSLITKEYLETKAGQQTSDANGTTFSNGVSWNTVTASNPVDTSNHITLYGSGTGSFGISVSSGAQNYIVRDGSNSHGFYAGGTLAGKVKNAIDEPKSLITKEYAEDNFQQGNGGIQNIDVPDYSEDLGRIVFDTPIDTNDIIKIEITGNYTTNDNAGNRGLMIRPNGSQGSYATYAYNIYANPSQVGIVYDNPAANAMPIHLSNAANADQSFHAIIIPNTREWTLNSNGWRFVTNSVWDNPSASISTIEFAHFNASTTSWYDMTMSLYTKSGTQYGYIWEPNTVAEVPPAIFDLEIVQPDVDPEVSN